MDNTVAIYLQHYLSSSMTFIYRQIISLNNTFNVIVLNSKIIENTELFPFTEIYTRKNDRYTFLRKFNDYFFRSYPKDATNPELSFLQRKYFEEIIQRNSVRLLHAHFGPSGIEILPLARHFQLPLVVTFHGFDASSLLKNRVYFSNIKELTEYAHFIFISNKMAENFITLGLKPQNFSIIRCGIPTNRFSYVKRKKINEKYKAGETVKFLQVSNFVEKKGHPYTLEAFSELLKFYDKAELILAGDGPTRAGIEELAEQLSINNKVQFKGRVNQQEAFELMKKSDVFVHHSITSKEGETEGIPTVIMEAMSTGLPVISTYHSGIAELVEDKVTGYLVEEKDISEYTNKMICLLTEENIFSKLSREKIIIEFDIDVEMEKLKSLYRNLMEN